MTHRWLLAVVVLGSVLQIAAGTLVRGQDLLEEFPLASPAVPTTVESAAPESPWVQPVATAEHVLHDVPAPQTPVRVARTARVGSTANSADGTSVSAARSEAPVTSSAAAQAEGDSFIGPTLTTRDRWVLAFLAATFLAGAVITFAVRQKPKRPQYALSSLVPRPAAKGT